VSGRKKKGAFGSGKRGQKIKGQDGRVSPAVQGPRGVGGGTKKKNVDPTEPIKRGLKRWGRPKKEQPEGTRNKKDGEARRREARRKT